MIQSIPYPLLIIVTIFMLIAPIYPMPHIIEKVIMLTKGELRRPIDIFDLFYHMLPAIILGTKVYLDFAHK
ncbi:MAG: hypothetical protein GF398_16475 [Chitinivibrionales bacterium]|nr:hypothetical protein [Chitinivibrionales bacterium]